MYVNLMSMHYHCCILVLELVICGNLRCIDMAMFFPFFDHSFTTLGHNLLSSNDAGIIMLSMLVLAQS